MWSTLSCSNSSIDPLQWAWQCIMNIINGRHVGGQRKQTRVFAMEIYHFLLLSHKLPAVLISCHSIIIVTHCTSIYGNFKFSYKAKWKKYSVQYIFAILWSSNMAAVNKLIALPCPLQQVYMYIEDTNKISIFACPH